MSLPTKYKNNLPAVPSSGGLIDIRQNSLWDGSKRYVFTNCLIAGTKGRGRDNLLRNLIADPLNNNDAVFVIQNGSSLPNNTLRDEFCTGWGARKFFSMDLGGKGFTAPINFFKGSDVDFVEELILILMNSYKNLSDDTKNFVERFLNEVMELYKIDPAGKKFSLDTIGDFNEVWLLNEANRLLACGKINQAKRDRVINYVNKIPLYRKEMNEFENFCYDIQKQNFAHLLSGAVSYSQLNSPNFVTFITLDHVSGAKQSAAFLKLFIHKAIREMRNSQYNTTFVFENVDVASIPEFCDLLKACQSSSGNNVYFTIDKINDGGNNGQMSFDPRAYCNSYFVFRQPIGSEADEWAKTAGMYKRDKATETTAPYRVVYGPHNTGVLGIAANLIFGNREIKTGVTHEIVDEFNIQPTEFMNLSVDESIVLLREQNGQICWKYVTW